MAAHIGLYEVGVPFEARPISFSRKQQRSEDFLALNALGTVPLLMIDGRALTEVAAILFYLARRYPDAKLWPEKLEAQAQVISWMSFIASTVHPARSRGPERARQIYGFVERKLAGPWAVGDSYTIADIHLFRLFWRYSHSTGFHAEDFPKLLEYRDRVQQRPAVRKTIEVEAAIGYELEGFIPPPVE